MNLNILFIGGAKRVSMGRHFIEAGRRLGFDIHLFSYELSKREPIAEIATVIEGLRWSDPRLYDHLHQCVVEHSIGIMIPFVDPAIEIAVRYRDRYADVFVPAGDAAPIHAMFDKAEAAAVFAAAGLEIPKTCNGRWEGFPMIAKLRNGSASHGLHFLHSPEDAAAFSNNGEYIIQEFIDGEEFSVDCYRRVDSGEILCISPRRRLETAGGEVTATRTVDDAELIEASRTALERLNLRGAVTLQYIRPEGGSARLIEINPRLGGGAVATVGAGADLPAMIISEAAGLPAVPQKPRQVLVKRYLNETVFEL